MTSPHPILGAFVLETVQAQFTAPVAELTVVSFTVPLFFYYRCHCNWCDLVLFVGRLLAQRPLCAAGVFASRCRVVVVLLLVVPTILFGTVFCCHCYCRDLELFVGLCASGVFASRCRVVVEVSLVLVLTFPFGTA